MRLVLLAAVSFRPDFLHSGQIPAAGKPQLCGLSRHGTPAAFSSIYKMY
jgi:hypothetical protein